jgi:cytoskeletal protein CcmA (bactofilin family)
MNKKYLKIIIFLALIAWPLSSLKAATTNAGQAVFIANNEVISGNLFAAGDSITVDGVISGDLIAGAKSITVNGRVEGDVIAAAQNITINGEVGGNVRVVGNIITINGTVARNINILGSEVILSDKARIGWDVILMASTAQIKGIIDGSLNTYCKQTIISGKIGKTATLKAYDENQAQSIIISSGAIINGDLNYTAKNKADIKTGAEISGQTNYHTPPVKEKDNITVWAWGRLFSILSMILIGLIFIFIIPKNTTKFINDLKTKPGKLLLIGVIVLLITPPLTLILALTIIGIPLAAILISIWVAVIFLAQALIAIFTGELIIKELMKIQTPMFWSLLLGVIIISLLFSLPLVGWLINLIITALGVGSILFYVTNQFKNI